MITITQLRAFLQNKQDNIAAVNYNDCFIDDSQLTGILRDIKSEANIILIGLIPSHKLEGRNVDNVATRDSLLFMLLNKVNRKDSHEKFLTDMEQCQMAAKEFVQMLIIDATDDDKPCDIAKLIDVNSIAIDPVWKLAGCDGYTVEMQPITSLWD